MATDERTLHPFGLGPRDLPLRLKDITKPEDETVTMHVPRKVVLTLSDARRVEILPGTQEVPLDIADHDWLLRNGATRHDAAVAKQAINNEHAVEEAEAALAAAQDALRLARAKARRDEAQAKLAAASSLAKAVEDEATVDADEPEESEDETDSIPAPRQPAQAAGNRRNNRRR